MSRVKQQGQIGAYDHLAAELFNGLLQDRCDDGRASTHRYINQLQCKRSTDGECQPALLRVHSVDLSVEPIQVRVYQQGQV